MKFTMTDSDGNTSELKVCTTNYSMIYRPVFSIGSHEPVEYAIPDIEFTITGFFTPDQMDTMHRETIDGHHKSSYAPPRKSSKKNVDVRRAELLQQLLDTFKEPKNAKD